MMAWVLLTGLAGVLVGGAAGWVLTSRRNRAGPSPPAGEGPPLLDWILRANGANGAWIVGPGTREVALSRGGFGESLDRLVLARLEHQRVGDGQGIERLEGGTLVYASLDGRAAGLLLPGGSSTGIRATALRDLARLLDHERWRPVLADVSKQQETPGESVESIALRFAHQLERLLGVEVAVAVPHATGVEITGVSLRSDRRLLRVIVEEGSPLDQVALGRSGPQAGVQNPYGAVISDRRRRADAAYLHPIDGPEGVIGAVALATPNGVTPTGPALALFRQAIHVAGQRLHAAIGLRALAEAATRDPLTGLHNRRGLQEAMTVISVSSGVLISADIDHFKKVNDELSHPAGDSALVHFARLLLQAVRDEDVVARVGGEEFTIWLPGAPLERGRQVAERIRQAFSWSDWVWQGEKRKLTASFGVAGWPETSASREGLQAQADAALYVAKAGGRNRVEVAKSPKS